MKKICSSQDCVLFGIEQDIQNFYFDVSLQRYMAWCKDCKSKYKKEWKKSNKENISLKDKKYREDNPDKIKEWRENNKEKIVSTGKKYYQNNKSIVKNKQKEYRNTNRKKLSFYNKRYRKIRRNTDISFRLRNNISRTVNRLLLKNCSSKNGNSILNFLPYSINDLRIYIENQFEPWMNWNNQGKYDPKVWKDNDSSTWVWQLDHIIPQYKLPYSSMEDENFKISWSLSNLRPLSAKQNLLDGVNKLR